MDAFVRHTGDSRMSKRFYITTAIDYVNGQPHLGHAYEKIIADVIARARRSLGQEVFFLTGLDEHGQKVQQAAQAEKKDPQAYCDALAADWQAFAKKLELTNDDFVRTTQPRHKEFVQATLTKLNAAGHFYKSGYIGFYSTKEETFLTEKDRRADGTFDPSYGEVAELKEENYFFKLGAHQQWLIDYIEANPDFVTPTYRRNEVLGFLKNNTLEDLCISRPAARLNWGIPLPFDKEFVTFVWFDALVNYISIPSAHLELSLWPADIHVIGKDIVKFHAVYWPIMLKTMGLPLPKQILVHGWWQKDGAKHQQEHGQHRRTRSPSLMNGVWTPCAFTSCANLILVPDGNWTDAGFKSRYQAELANGLGNLVNRSLSMLKRYRNGDRARRRSNELAADAAKAADETRALFKQSQLQSALQSIWGLVTRANQYVDQTAPFKLAKDPVAGTTAG
jgi:methionyl-tRNA synthetase